MRRVPVLFLAAVVVTVLGFGCSEDSKVVGPKGVATVMGQVYIYNCGVKDFINNPLGWDFRFAYNTGQDASVRLTNRSTSRSLLTRADLDGFTAALDTGTYDIIVETGFTFPDTFNTVRIVRDTVLELNIVYGWHMADAMLAEFNWQPPADSIGETAERKIIDSIASLLGTGWIEPGEAVRTVYLYEDTLSEQVTYVVPVADGVKTWQVVQRSLDIRQSYENNFPGLFTFLPDIRPCMWISSPGL